MVCTVRRELKIPRNRVINYNATPHFWHLDPSKLSSYEAGPPGVLRSGFCGGGTIRAALKATHGRVDEEAAAEMEEWDVEEIFWIERMRPGGRGGPRGPRGRQHNFNALNTEAYGLGCPKE
jgi:hypothetical protein